MTKDEVFKFLLKEKIVVQINDEYFVVSRTPIKKDVEYCKNLPERYKSVSIKQMYSFFIQDAQIPLKSTGSLVYLLHTKSKLAENIFRKDIIENPDIDYSQLIKNIKDYYKSPNTVKYQVSKLFTDDLWRALYENSSASIKPDNTKMR